MQESLTMGAEELGRLLMLPVKDPGRWIQRHHQEWSAKHGMPKKLPGGWAWSRLAVMAWIGTYGAPAAARTEATQNLIRQQQKNILDAFAATPATPAAKQSNVTVLSAKGLRATPPEGAGSGARA